MDFTILDVSDYDPPRVLSKTWRELISDSHYNEDNLFVRYIQLEKGLTLFRATGYNCFKAREYDLKRQRENDRKRLSRLVLHGSKKIEYELCGSRQKAQCHSIIGE